MDVTHGGRRSGGTRRASGLAVAGGIVAWTSVSLATSRFAPGGAGDHPIILTGAVYTGNASCSGSDCHAGDKKVAGGQEIGDELRLWEKYDAHRGAYEQLSEDKSKEIAAKLQIADPATDSKCLSCHGMDVKEAFRGKSFSVAVGVGCESCHGPAGGWKGDDARPGWLDPHKDAGWTAGQRKTLGAKGLREKQGLIDTSHLPTRAERCVTCHLKIDQAMVDAGHPRLEFELSAYSEYLYTWQPKYAIHWDDFLRGDMVNAQLWAVGQAVASAAGVEDAGLAAVYAKGLEIAAKHFGSADAEGLASAKYTPEKCLAAARDLADAGAMASTEMEANIIGYGVAALATAAVYGRSKDGVLAVEVVRPPIELAVPLGVAGAALAEKRAAYVAALKAVVEAASPPG